MTYILSISSQIWRKWNIKFNGDSDGLSIYEFLERIKELSIARHVPEQQLLFC